MNLIADLRYGVRGLLARPGFAAVAVFTLALGIGATVAIHSLYSQVLLRPLPVPEASALVNLSGPGPKPGSTTCNSAGPCADVFSYPMFRDLERWQREQGRVLLQGLAAHRTVGANLAHAGETRSGEAMLVSGGYFQTLRLQPALGRLLGPQDDAVEGEASAVVLSHAWWMAEFGGDAGVLGRSLVVNGQPLEIVGVAPAGFEGSTLGSRPQVFAPITLRWLAHEGGLPNFDNRRHYWVYVFARAADGLGPAEVAAALQPVYAGLLNEIEAELQSGMDAATLERFRARRIEAAPGARGQSNLPAESATPLGLLLGVSLLVLLIVCINLANLMLARGAARIGEFALRASIGASRGRLVGQLLVEAGLLGLLGALAALPVALLVLQQLAALLPSQAAGLLDLSLSWPVLGSALLLGLGTVLVFGLLPAWQLARTQPAQVLKSQSGQALGGAAGGRFRQTLVTAQIAFSMALLCLAGLFTQSLSNVSRVELGFDLERLYTFWIAPELNGYTPERSAQLFEQLEQRLAAVPGVHSATTSMVPLLSNSNWSNDVSVEGHEPAPGSDRDADTNSVGVDFLQTLGIPLLAGRGFSAADRADAPRVALVNRRFADKFGLGSEVVGRRMAIGRSDTLDIEIVGLVPDTHYAGLRQTPPPQYWIPRAQAPNLGYINLYLRSSLPDQQVADAARAVLAELDPQLPMSGFQPMQEQARSSIFMDRFVSQLSAALAVLATLLAATGLYGVLSFHVALRGREIGLRLALGAPGASVVRMVLRQVAWMGVLGGALGLLAAIVIGVLAQSLLFGLSPYEPLILFGSLLLLGGVLLLAALLPARRAAGTDPMIALRDS